MPSRLVAAMATNRVPLVPRSNVTDRPTVRSNGAMRRSSVAAMFGVLGQPGTVSRQLPV